MAETTHSPLAHDRPLSPEDARQQVLAALALPALDGLTEAQVRGMTCVWDGIALAPATAVDLGPRKKKRLDGEYDWFPRGCRRCVAERVWAWFFSHTDECGQCQKDASCPFSVAVQRIMREVR